MDLRHLRHMLAVMEEGSIGKAAERLHISQPALTKSIQRLEEELGVALFERKSRGMEATFYAESLRNYARSAWIGMTEAIKEIDALKNGSEGLLTVAGPPLIASGLLPEVTVRLTQERPRLQVQIVSQNHELFTSLLEGKFSLVVAMLYSEMPGAGLSKEWLFDDRLVLVMRPDHPAANLRKVTPEALQEFKWAIAAPVTWHLERLRLYFTEAGAELPRSSIESRDPTVLKAAIMYGDHIGIVSRLGVENEIEQGVLKAVDIDSPLMRRPIGIVWRENEAPSAAAGAFVRNLKAVCQKRGYTGADTEGASGS